MIRRLTALCALFPLAIFLNACTTDSDESVDPVVEVGFKARYQPDAAMMPFPTDAYRSGSTDGTLNIPEFTDTDPLIGQIQQMNLLDGYGLNSVIYADFSEPVDESTVQLGATVFVFNVTNPLAPVPVTTFVTGTADFQGGRSVVALEPTAPLAPLNTYAVFLTAGIQAETGGASAAADVSFQAMLDAYPADTANSGSDTVDALYEQMVKSLLDLAEGTGIGAANVVAAWTFTTQSTNASLATVEAGATAQVNAIVPLLRDPENPGAGVSDTSDLNPALAGLADVYAGVIEMPYYLDPANLLTSFWEADADDLACQGAIALGVVDAASASTTAFCAVPVVQATVRVPLLLTVPNAAAFAANPACGGVIGGMAVFQHGITQDRTNALAVADTLARACHATIAIDLPLHGITDTSNGLYASDANPLYAATTLDGVTEQTFDLDLIDNETGEAGADGVIDPSGEYFINLESPITARDALRQGAANLIHLVATIPAMDYNIALDGGASGTDFDGLQVRFVGHSLGGIVGTAFLGVNSDVAVDAAVLAAPGGDIVNLILNSASIYPEVEAGLVENGLTPGTRFFDEFFRNAQTLIEAGDPINYAAAAAANHNILMLEVVGGVDLLPDQVVPNVATQALADAMGLSVVTTTTVNPAGVSGLVQFNAGDHGSILNPAASADVTTEMQTEMAIYIGGNPLIPAGPGGNAIVITNNTVIAQ